MSRGITLYLHVHQPWRIRDYSVFDTVEKHNYFDGDGENDRNNHRVFNRVADKSYRPMNALLKKLLDTHPDFKFSLSISGTFLEQAEAWAPDVLEDFKALVATGRVELVAETYYHTLAFFYSREEFEAQVQQQRDKFRELFGVETTAFRNTELAYNDEMALWADQAGFSTILAEGWDPVLDWRSPNYVYRPAGTENIRLLLKNYQLSDDIAFRFSNKSWPEYPLNAEKYQQWINDAFCDNCPTVNLFMDYETFGEHQWSDTGIFSFMEHFVDKWLKTDGNTFYTVSEAARSDEPRGDISMPHTVTWADAERDLSAWTGNSLQQETLRHLYALEPDVIRSGDQQLIHDWRRLQTSDHVYYMSTKRFNDGNVHAYFSPYDSPYDAFLSTMNAIRDIRYRLIENSQFGIG